MTKKKVVILGGGVAGLSAAHELINRGYEVEVYEKSERYYGGKARSIDYDHKGEYKNPLPGEHGFRFFPGFYKHITDTMANIPYKNAKGGVVLGNLTDTTRTMIARFKAPPITMVASFPKSLADLKLLVHDLFGDLHTQLTKEEVDFFAERIWQLMTSCWDRRDNDYERLGWWQYMQADNFSTAYQTLLVEGLTRTLVAAQAQSASTKTGGDILLQLIYTMTDPSLPTDRVLDGPTNDKWLYAWEKYLEKAGVKMTKGVETTNVVMKTTLKNGEKKVESEVDYVMVKERKSGEEFKVNSDHFIMAMPVERAGPLISQDMIDIDGRLGYIPQLASSTAWMNGMQFYLSEDVPINHGHVICSNTPWALTVISQIQFWNSYDISKHGNGKVKGLVSVDISDWTAEGVLDWPIGTPEEPMMGKKKAQDCTLHEVKEEVWAQMKMSLNHPKVLLTDDMLIDWYLDRDIEVNPSSQQPELHLSDREPLLVNKVNTWSLRPEASCYVENLYFASDYVRTNTDLATMEGANEAARRAVNCILDKTGSLEDPCKIWTLNTPWSLLPMRMYDQYRYNAGLPWSVDSPFWLKAMTAILSVVYLITGIFTGFIKTKIVRPILDLIPYFKFKYEIAFILAMMIFTLVFALIDAKFDNGPGSAALLAIGIFSLIYLFAVNWAETFLRKLLLFGLFAGITELIADNWLVNVIDSLVYPASQPHIWASPWYMPIAWAVILVQVAYLGDLLTRKRSLILAIAAHFVLGVLFIPIFESCANLAGWWYYEPIEAIFNTPYYIILAEGMICSTLPIIFRTNARRAWVATAIMGVLQGLWIFVAYYISYNLLAG